MPPKVEQQRSVNGPRSREPTQPGSILSRASPVTELELPPIKMLIYGQNRVGKTTLACQFPKPLLLVSFEPGQAGGATSVKLLRDVDLIQVKSTRDSVQLAVELRSDRRYRSVVLDSVTSYQDIVLQEIMNLPEVPVQLNWGLVDRDQYRERSEKTKEGLRAWANLGKNVVFLAKERDHNPPDREKPKMLRGVQSESFFAADLGGATAGWLQDACDYLVRLYVEKEVKEVTKKVAGVDQKMEVETGRQVRRLRTLLHQNYAAGFRSPRPELIPEYLEEPTWDKIRALIEGGG